MVTEEYPAYLPGLKPGSMLAGYRLEAKVGAGGMAVVYRARDERLRRLVALKVLAPDLVSDAAFRRRFIGESLAAAAVDDPHIIPVYEAGEANGMLFIAMRFVHGGDLRLVLRREGPLAPARTAEFISPVASALDAAHLSGLVHRDVKPGNVLVDTRPGRPDHVYLSDFGISKGAITSVTMAGTAMNLTGTGQFFGTPGYSAPEQIEAMEVDGRADQYALACVTYELLTGGTPFQRHSVMAVLIAHVQEPPERLTTRRPDLPAAVDEVMAKALAKSREERYPTCVDFADALRDALRLPPYHARGRADTPPYPPAQGGPPSEPRSPVEPLSPIGSRSPTEISSPSEPRSPTEPLPPVVLHSPTEIPLPAVTEIPLPAVGLSPTGTIPQAAAPAPSEPRAPTEIAALVPGLSPDGTLAQTAGPKPREKRTPPETPTPPVAGPSQPIAPEAPIAPVSQTWIDLPLAEVPSAGLPVSDVRAEADAHDRTLTVLGTGPAVDDAPAGASAISESLPAVETEQEPGAPIIAGTSQDELTGAVQPIEITPIVAEEASTAIPAAPVPAAIVDSSPESFTDLPEPDLPVAVLAEPDLQRPDLPVEDLAEPEPPEAEPAGSEATVLVDEPDLPGSADGTGTPSPAVAATVVMPEANGRLVTDLATVVAGEDDSPPEIAVLLTRPGGDAIRKGTGRRQDWRRRLPVIAVVSALVGAAAVVVPLMLKSPAGSGQAAKSQGPATSATATPSSSRQTLAPQRYTPALLQGQSVSGNRIGSLAFNPAGTMLAMAGPGGLCVWDLTTRRCARVFTPMFAVAFSPDGTTLAGVQDEGNDSNHSCGNPDGVVRLWNVGTGHEDSSFCDTSGTTAISGGALSVAFSPDGNMLAVGDGDGDTYLWNVRTGKPVTFVTRPGEIAVNEMAFSPDGTTLAVGDMNGSTYLWRVNASTGTVTFITVITGIRNTDMNTAGVTGLAFSHDGSLLAVGETAATTHRTYLWNARTWKPAAAPLSDPGGSNVTAVAFGPDGGTLAIGDGNGSVYLWNTGSGTVLTRLSDPDGAPLVAVAFSSNGAALATSDQAGDVYYWSKSLASVTLWRSRI
jgi:serine/threonine protein kinase